MVDYRENTLWSVYIHILPKSISNYDYDKYYVGITKNPQKRWEHGKGYMRNRSQPLIAAAINKYGWDNFEHEIICSNLTLDEANSMEMKLISILNSYGKYGYNLTNGGEGVSGMIPKTVRKVYQFGMNGVYINSYISIQEAARQTGISAACICKSINKNRVPHGKNKYYWRDDDGISIKDNTYHLDNEKEIVKYNIFQFDINGNYIARYTSVSHAAFETGLDYDTIYNHINRTDIIKLYSEHHPYHWRQLKDVYQDNKGDYHIKIRNKVKKNVYVFDQQLNYINKYPSVKEASKDVGVKASTIQNRAISHVLKPLTKNKLLFRYDDDVELQSDGTYKIIC